ncbi:MAG: hypothetical protein R3B89_35325 [Polyangiaceae bacterium]
MRLLLRNVRQLMPQHGTPVFRPGVQFPRGNANRVALGDGERAFLLGHALTIAAEAHLWRSERDAYVTLGDLGD